MLRPTVFMHILSLRQTDCDWQYCCM